MLQLRYQDNESAENNSSVSLEAVLVAEHSLSAEESPHHHCVITKGGHDNIDGKRNHDFDRQQKSLSSE
jgi:hypothetical protein